MGFQTTTFDVARQLLVGRVKSSSAELTFSRALATPLGNVLTTKAASQVASSTRLLVSSLSTAAKLADYSGEAVSFFTSIRVPAALVAGSSLAACFSLVDLVADESKRKKHSKLKSIVLSMYHILSLASLLLSLNVILTSTTTSNWILLGSKIILTTSTYEYMKQACAYEFLLTRWSFYAAVFCFLGGVGARALLELNLLRKERIRSALTVIFSIASMTFHLVSFINFRLLTADSLMVMTGQVLKALFEKNMEQKSLCGFLSLACFLGSAISAFAVVLKSATKREDE